MVYYMIVLLLVNVIFCYKSFIDFSFLSLIILAIISFYISIFVLCDSFILLLPFPYSTTSLLSRITIILLILVCTHLLLIYNFMVSIAIAVDSEINLILMAFYFE